MILSKLFDFVNKHRENIILFIGVVFVSMLSFAAGYLISRQQELNTIRIEHNQQNE